MKTEKQIREKINYLESFLNDRLLTFGFKEEIKEKIKILEWVLEK